MCVWHVFLCGVCDLLCDGVWCVCVIRVCVYAFVYCVCMLLLYCMA